MKRKLLKKYSPLNNNLMRRLFTVILSEAKNPIFFFRSKGWLLRRPAGSRASQNDTLQQFLSRCITASIFSLTVLISVFFFTCAYSTEKNIKTLSHYSHFLGKEQKMNVYVPDSPGKHSVLYLLHGAYGSYVDWVEKSDIENIADKFNLIIVMPDGGQFGWYTDSPFEKENQYESYIIKELIPFIDSTFDTYAEKDGRGICGLSMGGYGAIKFASKYPDLFASASSMSGVLAILNHPDHWSMPKVFGSQKEHLDIWKANDLLGLAPALKGKVAIKFDTGIDDHTLNDNREYVRRLQALGIPFEYGEFPGTHNWDYWSGHIFEHLQFHSRYLKDAQKR